MTGRVEVFIDGAARGNPGPAAVGVIVRDSRGVVLSTISRALGPRTNNQAEYEALLAAVRLLQELKPTEVVINTDSELLFCQMTGRYRVRNPALQLLRSEVERAARTLGRVVYRHVPRTENREADRLANRALDRRMRSRDEQAPVQTEQSGAGDPEGPRSESADAGTGGLA
jgi:ribonuclease HI